MGKSIHKFLGREFNTISSTFVQCEATPGETSRVSTSLSVEFLQRKVPVKVYWANSRQQQTFSCSVYVIIISSQWKQTAIQRVWKFNSLQDSTRRKFSRLKKSTYLLLFVIQEHISVFTRAGIAETVNQFDSNTPQLNIQDSWSHPVCITAKSLAIPLLIAC